MSVKTKKELIAEAVAVGIDESELKGKTNAQIEGLIAQIQSQKEEVESVEAGIEEDVANEVEAKVGEQEQGSETEVGVQDEKAEEESEKQVLYEHTHQMSIFSDYIYNARNPRVDLVVENLGYGDVYVNYEGLAKVGDKSQRLAFKETKVFKGITKLCFASASQPVIQILEVR